MKQYLEIIFNTNSGETPHNNYLLPSGRFIQFVTPARSLLGLGQDEFPLGRIGSNETNLYYTSISSILCWKSNIASKCQMIIAFFKIKNFESFLNHMYWILKLYTNIHCEKSNMPLCFNNDIWWKFLKTMTFFMCFTSLRKPKFTIDNLIRGMDRGGSLNSNFSARGSFWIKLNSKSLFWLKN